MKYLVVDASLHGTGIRDYYEGGYIDPKDLNLSNVVIQRLKDWVLKYENEHFNGYSDKVNIDKLDQAGKEIALMIKNELVDVKMQYFSDARLTKETI